jgi:penicillin V acylase-like amidase (Ntn superfamily)
MNRLAKAFIALTVMYALPITRADACTYVDVKAKDGSVVVGRTIEWGFPMEYTFTVVPRGQAFTASYPADKVAKGFQALTWTSKYAYAGVGVTVQQGLDSAQNEAGLNVEGLNLPSFTGFSTVTPDDTCVLSTSKRDGYTLNQLSTGDGMTGLPGDFKSASRFVKVSVIRSYLAPVDTAEEACSLAGHIINTVDIPRGAVDSGTFEGRPALETAQVSLVKDLSNNRVFVSDYDHRLAYVLVDLKKLFAQNRKIGPVLFSRFVNRAPVDVTDALK